MKVCLSTEFIDALVQMSNRQHYVMFHVSIYKHLNEPNYYWHYAFKHLIPLVTA